MTISVLLADDAAMVRAGFAALLDAQSDVRVVGQATTGREAVAQAARLRPDVVLMDVRMPEMDGIEATRRIGAPDFPASPPPRILMLTTFSPGITRRMIEQFAARRPRAPRDAALLAQLTDREREVLMLIAEGRSNKEVGEGLFISDHTVKTHVGRLLTKLGVRDRVQLVILAYDNGLVSPLS